MFNKHRDALEASKQYQSVKKHVQENQLVYAVLGGVAIGAGGMFLLRGGSPISIANNVTPVIAPVISPVISPVMNNIVSNGGPMRKIVLCIETGERWGSVTEAAEKAGVLLSRMSQHLNGHKDQIKGLHYVIDGLAAG